MSTNRTTENKALRNSTEVKASNQQQPVGKKVAREINRNYSNDVSSLVENSFVSNMEANKSRESNLSYDQAPQFKYDIRTILSYIPRNAQANDLFSAFDEQVKEAEGQMDNGINNVTLLGCELWTKCEDGQQRLVLTLKNTDTGVIKDNISLFPGKEYTDRYGVVHSAGHNWKALMQEVARQRNKAGVGYKPSGGFVGFIKNELTKGFQTWLLWDGQYLNMYTTETKYQHALDQLAKDIKAGSPAKKSGKPIPKKLDDDQAPFDVDEK